MIIYDEARNIFRAEEQTLLTPINIDAVGGGGLPVSFRYAFPGLFHDYCRACAKQVFENEGLFVFDTRDGRKIVCMAMKQNRKHTPQEKLDALEEGLRLIATEYQKLGITSMAIPEIGNGYAELAWEDVSPIVYRCFEGIELKVGICRGAVAV